MSSIFSKIIQGEIPSYKIYEDNLTYAFLTIEPHTLGHTLVIPKCEVDHLHDLDEPFYSGLFSNAKKLSLAIKKATGCKRVGLMVAGFGVPHVHVHLIPINSSEDLEERFAHKEDEVNMKQIQEKIIAALGSD